MKLNCLLPSGSRAATLRCSLLCRAEEALHLAQQNLKPGETSLSIPKWPLWVTGQAHFFLGNLKEVFSCACALSWCKIFHLSTTNVTIMLCLPNRCTNVRNLCRRKNEASNREKEDCCLIAS